MDSTRTEIGVWCTAAACVTLNTVLGVFGAGGGGVCARGVKIEDSTCAQDDGLSPIVLRASADASGMSYVSTVGEGGNGLEHGATVLALLSILLADVCEIDTTGFLVFIVRATA